MTLPVFLNSPFGACPITPAIPVFILMTSLVCSLLVRIFRQVPRTYDEAGVEREAQNCVVLKSPRCALRRLEHRCNHVIIVPRTSSSRAFILQHRFRMSKKADVVNSYDASTSIPFLSHSEARRSDGSAVNGHFARSVSVHARPLFQDNLHQLTPYSSCSDWSCADCAALKVSCICHSQLVSFLSISTAL